MSERGQARAYRFTAIAIAGFLAALVVNLLDYYGPRIEGALWPVAISTNTRIDRITTEENKILVEGVMFKRRDCDLISSAAFIYDVAGNRVNARVERSESVRLLPPGKDIPWGPWKVDTPVWARKATLKVVTIHQCHPLWPTQTTFLQGAIE